MCWMVGVDLPRHLGLCLCSYHIHIPLVYHSTNSRSKSERREAIANGFLQFGKWRVVIGIRSLSGMNEEKCYFPPALRGSARLLVCCDMHAGVLVSRFMLTRLSNGTERPRCMRLFIFGTDTCVRYDMMMMQLSIPCLSLKAHESTTSVVSSIQSSAVQSSTAQPKKLCMQICRIISSHTAKSPSMPPSSPHRPIYR